MRGRNCTGCYIKIEETDCPGSCNSYLQYKYAVNGGGDKKAGADTVDISCGNCACNWMNCPNPFCQ